MLFWRAVSAMRSVSDGGGVGWLEAVGRGRVVEGSGFHSWMIVVAILAWPSWNR